MAGSLNFGASVLLMGLTLSAAAQNAPVTTPITLVRGTRSAVEFAQVSAARVLSDGRVLVADRRAQRLVMLDAALQSATQVGREGRGPGEYLQPNALVPIAGDSTAVVDMGALRLTVIDATGRAVSAVPMLREYSLLIPTAALGSHWIWHQPEHARAVRNLRVGVLRIDRATGAPVDTVAVLTVPPQLAPERAQIGWGPPGVVFFTRDTYAVSPDGWIAVVRHDPYRVDWISPTGATRQGPVRAFTRVAVTREDKDEWATQFAQRRGSMMLDNGRSGTMQMQRPDISRITFPTHYPPFLDDAALAGPDGEVWVRRALPSRLRRVEYDVFARSGSLAGTVTLAAGERVVGFRGRDVLLVTADEDGVEWLVVARRG